MSHTSAAHKGKHVHKCNYSYKLKWEQYWCQQVELRSSATVDLHSVKIQRHYGLSELYFTEHSQLGSNSEVKNLHLFMTALFIFYYSFISFSEDSQCQWAPNWATELPHRYFYISWCVFWDINGLTEGTAQWDTHTHTHTPLPPPADGSLCLLTTLSFSVFKLFFPKSMG